jgi:hypothetical protein
LPSRLWILLRKRLHLVLLGIAGIVTWLIYAFGRRPFGVKGDAAEAHRRDIAKMETERTVVRAKADVELEIADNKSEVLKAELQALREMPDERERARRLIELADRVRRGEPTS